MNDREQVIGGIIATMMETTSPAEVLRVIAKHLYRLGDDDGAPEATRAAESVHKAQIILQLSALEEAHGCPDSEHPQEDGDEPRRPTLEVHELARRWRYVGTTVRTINTTRGGKG